MAHRKNRTVEVDFTPPEPRDGILVAAAVGCAIAGEAGFGLTTETQKTKGASGFPLAGVASLVLDAEGGRHGG
jgi:hypothetical protein